MTLNCLSCNFPAASQSAYFDPKVSEIRIHCRLGQWKGKYPNMNNSSKEIVHVKISIE